MVPFQLTRGTSYPDSKAVTALAKEERKVGQRRRCHDDRKRESDPQGLFFFFSDLDLEKPFAKK
mgnify:FL=1|jgi:hypothetical protein